MTSMTSTTDSTTATPLVPRPLSDDYDSDWMDKAAPEDTTQVWGHCADFCESSDSSQTNGLTIGEHGVWCRSLPTGYLDALDMSGRSATLDVAVVKPYVHGTYRLEDMQGERLRMLSTEVQLRLVAEGVENDPHDDDYDSAGRNFNISTGDARRLAAALVRAAEVAEHLDRDFNGAKERRRRG